MLQFLNEELKELRERVINGSLLLEDTADKIAVQYAHKVGAVEGLEYAIQFIKDLKDEEKEDDERV